MTDCDAKNIDAALALYTEHEAMLSDDSTKLYDLMQNEDKLRNIAQGALLPLLRRVTQQEKVVSDFVGLTAALEAQNLTLQNSLDKIKQAYLEYRAATKAAADTYGDDEFEDLLEAARAASFHLIQTVRDQTGISEPRE